jgi:integrase
MGKRLKSGFYWRGGVVWVRTDPIEKRPQSTGCRTPEAALLWFQEREKLAASPNYAASLSATLGEWILKMLKIKKATKSEGTVHMYTVKLGHYARIWGKDLPLARIDSAAVDEYILQRREEGAVSNTIARELTCLRQLLRHAKRAKAYGGALDEVMPIGFSADYQPVTRTLRLADVPVLLAALRNDTERAWVAFALATGADVGDIERARPEDYDAARGVMRIRGTKTTTRDDEVPILPHVRALFDFALPHLPISWPRASHGVGEACKRAGLKHLSPKDLRRSAASWLVAAGADQRNVGRFLRHKNDAMVRKVYGQVTATELGALLETSSKSLQSTHGPLAESADAGDLKGSREANRGGRGDEKSRTYETGGKQSNAARRAVSLHSLKPRKLPPDVETYVSEQLAKAYPHAFDGGDLKLVQRPLRRAAAAIERGKAPRRVAGGR